MERTIPVELMNMCMVCDEASGRVLVLDKTKGDWQGLTFPGGHVEPGEGFVESAVREVYEESGLRVSQLEYCGLMDWECREDGRRSLVFLYRSTRFTGQLQELGEEGRVCWMPLEDLIASPDKAIDMEAHLRLLLNPDPKLRLSEMYRSWGEGGRGAPRFQ